ncbi:MAG: hypothetical protein IKM23_02515 [Bacteroidales bacterium]|nr:hypothetical protein [Bacteroidales bacterium]
MKLEELIKEAVKLPKKDKTRIINALLESMSNKEGRTLPVYLALDCFCKTYKQFKGTEYRLSKADFRWMKELLLCIESKLNERHVYNNDYALLNNLDAFLTAVKNMPNKWYFDNRFTPEGLSKDFDKIYGNIFKNNAYGRTKTAFDYL